MTKAVCAFISLAFVYCVWLGVNLASDEAESQTDSSVAAEHEANQASQDSAVGHPTFVSPHASPIAIHGGLVFTVNTPADTVDVIDTDSRKVVARVNVGVDPVSVAVRPDGKEVWVSNHVSDSVSIIDNDASSPSYLHVIATVQEFDDRTKATRFDEPVGIAFANNKKAYVALSSENQIAVVNVNSRRVEKRLTITAQDPRAIKVRGNRLYVIPFESNNKTQLSGGTGEFDGDLVTFNAFEHAIRNNNVLSLGAVMDIIKHPKVPDRDLYIFDTETDELVEVVDTLGTLLYGLTVDSQGRVFVAQTDARNDANGRSGTKKHGLKEMENRAFLNRITSITFDGKSAQAPEFIDLEPLPPNHPESGMALATPFAIRVSEDDSTLFVSAAGSDKLFTVNASNGEILGRVNVDAVPRGIALENNSQGQASRAWVLNAVANTVSLVDVSDPSSPEAVETITLQDPTHPAVKRGRIAFNTASASTTGTFSCASCHPDGHTDQLLWVLKTPIVTGGDQIMPRSTMPIRGLRDTAPYHWDGIPGDPYGGNNSANVHGSDEPNSDVNDPASSTRHLVDGGLAATMSMVGDKTVNDEGKSGALSAAERDDMALFLLSVPYPPAQRRAYTNVLSKKAERGFELFHIEGDYQGQPNANVCGDCHRMPFWVSTNTPGTGMDAPTWRGAYDRFLILPQGRLNIIDFDFYHAIAERGIPERNMWQFSWAGRRRFDPVWDMVLEGSTGHSGSFARQVSLNKATAEDEAAHDLLGALELSAKEGAIVLEGEGVWMDQSQPLSVNLEFKADAEDGGYIAKADGRTFSRQELAKAAAAGKFVGTLTGRHGKRSDIEHPQPAIWTTSSLERQSGRQDFPILYEGNQQMTVSGRHFDEDAFLIVDGRRVEGTLSIEDETVVIDLPSLPAAGMHLLQVQHPSGMFSNDFIFHVTEDEAGARALKKRLDRVHLDPRSALARAVSRGDLDETKQLLKEGARINARQPRGGSTALSAAALHGRLDLAEYLLDQGAKVDATNQDGNTPLHVAAFLCRTDIVKLLLENGSSAQTKNRRGESAVEVVSAPWSDELAGFYRGIGRGANLDLDLDRIERERPQIAKLLRERQE